MTTTVTATVGKMKEERRSGRSAERGRAGRAWLDAERRRALSPLEASSPFAHSRSLSRPHPHPHILIPPHFPTSPSLLLLLLALASGPGSAIAGPRYSDARGGEGRAEARRLSNEQAKGPMTILSTSSLASAHSPRLLLRGCSHGLSVGSDPRWEEIRPSEAEVSGSDARSTHGPGSLERRESGSYMPATRATRPAAKSHSRPCLSVTS